MSKAKTLPKLKPTVVPAEQPVEEVTEEERRAQEARDYVNSLKPTEQMTEERIQEIRAEVLRSIPHSMGKPVPETAQATEEQLRSNPSNYQPAIEAVVKDQQEFKPSSMMGAMLHGYPAQIRTDGTMYVPEHPLLDTRMPYEVQLDYLNRLKALPDHLRAVVAPVIKVDLSNTAPPEEMREVTQTSGATVSVNPSVFVEEKPEPVVEVDQRQQWVCVQGDGIRTNTNGSVHPVFGSDAHLVDQLVRCPVCNSISVRKVMPGENPSAHP